ncbi:LysR family transcriptional regulator [Klebsiella pneumoniae]
MRPVLDFNALKIFIAVVERDSFVGASKALEMPTSNVSRCISQLEDKLNLQLIERSTRHMKLTQAGHLLYTRAKPLLEALEQTKQACQPYIDDGWLIEIEFEQSAAPLQLFALYSDRRYLPAKTRALIDFMHQRLSH